MFNDSALAYNMITQQSKEAWRYIYTTRKIWGMLALFYGIQLVLREANMVADGLAKWAHVMVEMIEWHHLQEIPRSVQKLVFADRIGLPSFCNKCK